MDGLVTPVNARPTCHTVYHVWEKHLYTGEQIHTVYHVWEKHLYTGEQIPCQRLAFGQNFIVTNTVVG